MSSQSFHRRHLRSTSAWTLFAWVLAVMAGLAHACQLQPYAAGDRAPVAAAPAIAAAHGQHGGPALDADAGGSDASMAAGCLKFCDESSSAVAKAGSTSSDLPGMPAPAVAAWQGPLPTAGASRWLSAALPASHGPPLFLRFLRLTI